ncbi:SKIV2L2 [Symbiodinium microadriaticum]|nr:SKIV2L2 [Symbiodinium microadriaticum]
MLEAVSFAALQKNVEERLFRMLRSLVAALFLASSAQAAKSLRERLHGSSPCQCQADTSAVARPSRTKPKCIFIDLGAADGNSYNAFLRGEYGQIKDCPNQEYEAYLVEANPFFQKELKNKAAKSEIFPMMNGAWMCEADTTFHVVGKASAASSLAPQGNANDVQVHLINVISLIKSKTIPGDKVLLKVDIEGAEFDLIPCLARSDVLSHDMTAFVEEHYFLGGVKRSLTGVTDKEYKDAKQVMMSKGVKMPTYSSITLLDKGE